MEFVFPTDDEDRAAVAKLVPDGRRFAVLLPGTNWMRAFANRECQPTLVVPLAVDAMACMLTKELGSAAKLGA